MISIPGSFSETIIHVHGEKGGMWLASLHDKIAWCEDQWKLETLLPFALSYNYVAPVVFKDKTHGVLKICIPGKACDQEINALKFYGGSGMCRLIDCNRDLGILLLERANPGNDLTSVREENTSVKIAASLIRKMKCRKASTWYSFPVISDLAVGIRNLRGHYKGRSGPFSELVVQKVESLFPYLISSQRDVYVLHGDFHHQNILQAGNEWIIIDPKGVVVEMEYELIPFLLNNLPNKGFEQIIDDRVFLFRNELEIQIDRTYAWGLCHALLSAWWNIEDNLGLSDQHLAILDFFSSRN